ncbi:MAG: hypothetical protein NTW12_07080 [Deltaproteobacteria bacterium]|nr:hypothetical protein [Deltaproteobacteria bacterium]
MGGHKKSARRKELDRKRSRRKKSLKLRAKQRLQQSKSVPKTK